MICYIVFVEEVTGQKNPWFDLLIYFICSFDQILELCFEFSSCSKFRISCSKASKVANWISGLAATSDVSLIVRTYVVEG